MDEGFKGKKKSKGTKGTKATFFVVQNWYTLVSIER